MRKVEQTIFTFDELSDAAKDKAREWMRGCIEAVEAAEGAIEMAESAAKLLGFQSFSVESWDTNPIDASFRGDWHASRAADCGAKVRAEFGIGEPGTSWARSIGKLYSCADALQALAAEFPDGSGRAYDGSRARCINQTSEFDTGIDRSDETHSRAEWEAIEAGDAEIAGRFADAVGEFASWIATLINAEIEWQFSDERIDETIRANEYEFTEDGSIY